MGMELSNPVTDELRENFRGVVSTNFAALTSTDDVKGLIGSIMSYKGTPIMRCALRLWVMDICASG